YSEPQESGNRTDVRWMNWISKAGLELSVQATGHSLLQTGCYPVSMNDLESHKHPYELPVRDFLTINIDHLQMGLAGDNSWGALPHEEYRIQPKGTYKFGFEIGIKNSK
ncbi:MAG: beta-galactosidase, partial [Planctomycetota bacterium]